MTHSDESNAALGRGRSFQAAYAPPTFMPIVLQTLVAAANIAFPKEAS